MKESKFVDGYRFLSKTPGVVGGRTVVHGGRMEPKWVIFYADHELLRTMFNPGEPYDYICLEAIEECRRYLAENPEARFQEHEDM